MQMGWRRERIFVKRMQIKDNKLWHKALKTQNYTKKYTENTEPHKKYTENTEPHKKMHEILNHVIFTVTPVFLARLLLKEKLPTTLKVLH